MQQNVSKHNFAKTKTFAMCLLLLVTLLSAGVSQVQAAGSNQNDLGYNTDLPGTSSLAPTMSLNGMAPHYSGILSGELEVGDDQDWFLVTLGANEGLEVQINYAPTYTSPTNGTVYTNEFDLAIYDSSLNQIDYSFLQNPEIVTTNSSTSVSGHGGSIYVQILRYAGFGSYDLQLWTWSTSSSGGGFAQNDLGFGTDLPNSVSASNIPTLAFSGTTTVAGQLDPGPDDYDYFAVNLAGNEGLAVSLSFDASDDLDLGLWDSPQHSVVVASYGTANPEYVTTNGSFGTNAQTVYVEILTSNHGSPLNDNNYTVTLWKFSTGGGSTVQGDMGLPNYDLPNTHALLLADSNWPTSFNGLAPVSTGNSYAQLDPNDNEDWLSITLDSNEAVAFEVSYSPTSSYNGSTYVNDVMLTLYDANMNYVDSSIGNNPELVTMNNSAAGAGSHGGTVYVQVTRFSGYVDYGIQLWTWSVSSSGTSNQSDLGNPNYDLPDSQIALFSDPFWPSVLIGNAPFYSGVYTAELDQYGDNEDWMAFALGSNEGFAIEISYSSFSFVNSSIITNDFSIEIYDANLNSIDFSSGNNPDYVTTNNSVTGPSSHSGIIFVQIVRNSGFGVYDLEYWTWSASGGGGSSSGQTVPSPCVGNSIAPDILEPNNNQQTATIASFLPIYCTGLSAELDANNNADEDYYEIEMISGVTYYFNLTFIDANGDIDARLEDQSGSSLTFNGFSSMSSSSDNEAGEYTAPSNFTAYFVVYHYSSFSSGATANSYDIEISTDNPGGGQSFSNIQVEMSNRTSFTIEMSGLVVGDSYQYDYSNQFEYVNNGTLTPAITYGPFNFTATSTNQTFNHSISTVDIEGFYDVASALYDANGNMLSIDGDSIYHEVLVLETTSSTTGDIYASNLTNGAQYTLYWGVINLDNYISMMINNNVSIEDAFNATIIYSAQINFTANNTPAYWQVAWNNPTTMDNYSFFGLLLPQGNTLNLTTLEGYIGIHEQEFVPQLPSAVIIDYSLSVSSTTNDFSSEGLDLVAGDTYYQQFRVEDSSGADIEYSNISNVTATAQNMSFGTFYYTTPSISGVYCLFTDLYDANYVQIVGDSVCVQFIFDDDADGVPNEQDLCLNTPQGAMVNFDGCASSQLDSDGDGYNDSFDDFPLDNTQWQDTDGDGYGDNPAGNSPDAFPTDNTQWSDIDGDGYGDNAFGNSADSFPYDPTQWFDTDGDGYGDNANGNNPDLWPTDASQWTDSDGDGYGDNPTGTAGDAFPFDNTQWADSDNDGYGDNLNGNYPDLFPNDSTQWADSDGDGYGDNVNGNNADKFPNDPTQWFDSDNDGYGDNQQGNDPDAFPTDGTQWADADGDGFGDNQNGNNADKFPQDSTQWQDSDNDGYGDNANGNNPDLCPATPFGEAVDSNGCSTSQTDLDLDGVADADDGCPNTPAGEIVNINGCSETQLDDDNDGVVNQYDLCAATPVNAVVNESGCANSQLDSDNDGINDALDSCPATDPQANVNGFGCAANQRDIDSDGVNDNLDTCPNTPLSEIAANNGCSESQTDSDLDGVFNNVDQCPNTTLSDLDGDGEFDIDSVGCSPTQYDDDNDMIDNTVDVCPATPAGEQVDSDGCAQSQLDEDNDDIWNSADLCFDTAEGLAVDQNGCSEFQKDDDQDGLVNALDVCPNTPPSEIIDQNGCSLTQLDTDGDGVNDLDDAFPNDKTESMDTDQDGVPDRLDAYPLDAARSEAETEDEGSGFMFILAAIFAIGVIGALLVIRNSKQETDTSPFSQSTFEDESTEANMSEILESKDVPIIEQQTEQQEVYEGQTWEENGVHWSMAPDGSLSYYDVNTQSWLPYEN